MLLTSQSTWEPCKRQSSTRYLHTLPNHFRPENLIFFNFPLQIKTLGNKLKEGDVILSNHPCAGGSHLPDLTVITPVTVQISAFILPLFLLPFLNCIYVSLQRCFRKGWAALSFLWPAGGTMQTLAASLQALCPPTPPPYSRKGRSSLLSNLSQVASSRRQVRADELWGAKVPK